MLAEVGLIKETVLGHLVQVDRLLVVILPSLQLTLVVVHVSWVAFVPVVGVEEMLGVLVLL